MLNVINIFIATVFLYLLSATCENSMEWIFKIFSLHYCTTQYCNTLNSNIQTLHVFHIVFPLSQYFQCLKFIHSHCSQHNSQLFTSLRIFLIFFMHFTLITAPFMCFLTAFTTYFISYSYCSHSVFHWSFHIIHNVFHIFFIVFLFCSTFHILQECLSHFSIHIFSEFYILQVFYNVISSFTSVTRQSLPYVLQQNSTAQLTTQ